MAREDLRNKKNSLKDITGVDIEEIEETTEYAEEGRDYQDNNSAGKEEKQTSGCSAGEEILRLLHRKDPSKHLEERGTRFFYDCCFPAKPADDGLFF